jgi:pimeloyl-ACP methyl ester carboxylesterase
MHSTSSDALSLPMPEPVLHFVSCPGASKTDAQQHRMAYWSWGDVANPRVLVCVHGLSRQGRDFDALAQAMSGHYRVVCPDVVGRGESDWLADPRGYQVFSYASDMVQLMKQLKAEQAQASGKPAPEVMDIDWVGTSMGGLIGLAFSTVPSAVTGVRLRRFALNDVGPRLRAEAVARIGEYLGQPLHFDTAQAAADYLWTISTGFGPHTPAEWFRLCVPLLRPADGGGFKLHYDPAIGVPFRSITPEDAASGEAMLWQVYDAMTCQVLLLRGQDSDLLDAETAQAMTERGPRARLVAFPGVGHAPTLIHEDQIAPIRDFLLA